MLRTVSVDAREGTAWTVDMRHPDVRDSVNRVLLLDGEGRVKKEIPLAERYGGTILLDPQRNCAWLPTSDPGGAASLMKFSTSGELLAESPVPAQSLALEPDTGYVWVSGPRGMFRLDTHGHVVW